MHQREQTLGERIERQVKQARGEANYWHKHAADCKKAPTECVRCKLAITWFAGLPLWLLARVLAE